MSIIIRQTFNTNKDDNETMCGENDNNRDKTSDNDKDDGNDHNCHHSDKGGDHHNTNVDIKTNTSVDAVTNSNTNTYTRVINAMTDHHDDHSASHAVKDRTSFKDWEI